MVQRAGWHCGYEQQLLRRAGDALPLEREGTGDEEDEDELSWIFRNGSRRKGRVAVFFVGRQRRALDRPALPVFDRDLLVSGDDAIAVRWRAVVVQSSASWKCCEAIDLSFDTRERSGLLHAMMRYTIIGE